MMKKITFLLVFALFLACNKDKILPNNAPNPYYKIVSIAKENTATKNTTTTTFEYDDQNSLISATESNFRKYVYTYDGNKRLIQTQVYDLHTNELISRDSFAYNSENKRAKIYSFSRNGGIDFSLSHFSVLSYDGEGLLEFVTSFIIAGTTKDTVFSTQKHYFWKKGNISRIENISETGSIRHIATYEYDNNLNYTKNHPYFIQHFWESKNNVTCVSYKDFTGLLDLICYKCKTTYHYNASNLPTKIKEKDSEQETTIVYE